MSRAWLATSLCWLSLQAANADVVLTGRVADENNTAVPGASISFAPAAASREVKEVRTLSGPTGGFQLRLAQPGQYLVSVEREGYFRIEKRRVEVQDDSGEISFSLVRVKALSESVDVKASLPGIDFDTTSTETTLTGAEIIDIPYATTNNLKNALAVSPGVVRDSAGGIHINGGEENQVLYTLQGFNITNPLTGRFDTRLSVDAVQSVTVSSGAYSAEYGKGSSGMLAIQTQKGEDRLRYSATNFVPGVEIKKSVYIGGWTPRVTISGPIRKGRAWFSNSIDTQYDKYIVEDLPEGQDQVHSWRFGNLLSTQINLTASNILSASFLVNVWNAPQFGLGALDPPESTVDRRSRQWFYSVKDQKYFARGSLLEFGYAGNRTFGRQIPQGQEPYILTPEGKRGNHYVDGIWKAGRDQWIANLFLPSFTAIGRHQVKAGIDLDLLNYRQDVRRTGYQQYRVDNTLSRIVTFGGQGRVSRGNFEAASYITDSWRLRSLLLEFGFRQDWDQIRRRRDLSPRAGFAWRPRWIHNMKVSGGYSVVNDATSLRIFTRHMDQHSWATYFSRDGGISRGPALTIFTIDNERLPTPRSRNWNLSVEQRLPWDLYARFGYLRRRGARGFTYFNQLRDAAPPAQFSEYDALYELSNLRRDSYASYDFIVRKAFTGEYMLMASYTRSRALSNSVADISIEDPVAYSDTFGPMPWDTPNRLLTWGYLPLPRKNWAVAYLLELRAGFPFSVSDDDGQSVGAVNAHRMPDYFNLNLHVERRFEFRHQRWAFRGGFNNITNHQNPTQVNSNFGSPHFLTYYGGSGRSLNFRIRWLGKS